MAGSGSPEFQPLHLPMIHSNGAAPYRALQAAYSETGHLLPKLITLRQQASDGEVPHLDLSIPREGVRVEVVYIFLSVRSSIAYKKRYVLG